MTTRSRRSKVDNSADEFAKLRSGKHSRLDDFEDSNEDIYDYYDDQDYSKYVAKNREKAKSFVISDGVVDSSEYQDDGEELWVQQQERAEKENIPKKSNKLTTKQQTRISSLLLTGASAGPKQKTLTSNASISTNNSSSSTIRKAVMSADTLDSYLDDFDCNPFDENEQISQMPIPDDVEVKSAPLSIKTNKSTATIVKSSNPLATPVQSKQIQVNDESPIADGGSPMEISSPVDNSKVEDNMEKDEEIMEEQQVVESKSQPKIQFTTPSKPRENNQKIQPKPIVMPSTQLQSKNTKPKAKIEKADQSDWFHMCDDTEESKNNADIVSENDNEASSTITNDEEETNECKKVFFLDACYEQEMPGTVILFGKYFNTENNNRSESCCIRVENLYRTLFFLPRVFKAKKTRVREESSKDGKPGKWIDKWEENDEKIPVSIRDVCNEFNSIRKQYGINEFRAKPVKRKYCFTLPHIPREEHEYVKIQFKETSQTKNVKDFSLEGETYSHIFCLNQNLLERVILKRKIMGPQWIKVNNFKECDRKFSWCKKEWKVNDVKDIEPIASQNASNPPNLKVLSLKINTILNHKKQANEIVTASVMIHNEVKMDQPTVNWERSLSTFTILRKLEGVPWPIGFQQKIRAQSANSNRRKIQLCESEMNLLNELMNYISFVDPDVIVGHNYIGFDLDVLLHRMKANNVSTWSKLGRLQRRHIPKLQSGAGGQRDSTWEEKKISSGRLICDTYLASKDLAMIRQASYSLSSLAKQQLDMIRYEIDQDSLHEYYRNGFSSIPANKTRESVKNQIEYLDDRNLQFLITHSENDAFLQLGLMFKFQIIPLTKQLTNLSGNLWARSLTGSRAERIAFYLLHEFHNRKYITPDKANYKSNDENSNSTNSATSNGASKRKKATYAGGLVLPPKRGFYDQFILLLDFNSLYPSLIQEYNICFTTLDPKVKYDEEGIFVPIHDDDVEKINSHSNGILPDVLKQLIDRRKIVKQLIKTERDQIKLQQLNIRQQALKLTANSMYGCLGFPQSRFFAMPLAELITRKGREALRLSKSIAEDKLGYDVIYGDTDSIMVNTGLTDISKAKEIALLIKKTINKKYKQLELDLDGIFKTMLLLKKKKYAALMINPNDDSLTIRETKGLDLVRRDWCPLSKEIGNQILDFILSGDQIDEVLLSIHNYLRKISESIHEISMDKFVITKSLSKEPEAYSKSTPLPHVNVALALIQQGKSVRIGNHIPYVICKSLDEEISCSYAQRAFHPEHIEKAGGLLEIDYDWYLENQILAPIIRLCDPIQGTSPKRIAECLGIGDSKLANRYNHNSSSLHDNDDRFFKPLSLDDIERFKDAEKFILHCNYCQTNFPFENIVTRSLDDDDGSSCFILGHSCTNDACQAELEYSVVCNQLHLFIRKHIQKYYAGWLSCDDPSCSHRTRSLFLKSGVPKCTFPRCGGKMNLEYSSSRLFNQLCYLQAKFDYSKFKSNATPELLLMGEAYAPFYSSLSKIIQHYLNLNAHNFVDCKQLFSCFKQLTISQ